MRDCASDIGGTVEIGVKIQRAISRIGDRGTKNAVTDESNISNRNH